MKITDDMIVIAAQALQHHIANRSGHGKKWEQLNPVVRKQYLEEARIALEAALA